MARPKEGELNQEPEAPEEKAEEHDEGTRPSIAEYLKGLPPSELHEHAVAALEGFMMVAGEIPPNRCYDGFKNLMVQIGEMQIGAAQYLERLRRREAAQAPEPPEKPADEEPEEE